MTDVLPFTGDRESPAIKKACDRGHAVHRITEDHDRGLLNLIVEEEYAGYLEGWKKFLANTNAKVVDIEMKIGGPAHGYVGRLDRVLDVDGHLWIVDIKSGPPWPTHGPQLAAYEQAYVRQYLGPGKAKRLTRACVHLSSAGSYKIKVHTSIHDWATFKAYLRIAYYEIAAGLREPPKERDE